MFLLGICDGPLISFTQRQSLAHGCIPMWRALDFLRSKAQHSPQEPTFPGEFIIMAHGLRHMTASPFDTI